MFDKLTHDLLDLHIATTSTGVALLGNATYGCCSSSSCCSGSGKK